VGRIRLNRSRAPRPAGTITTVEHPARLPDASPRHLKVAGDGSRVVFLRSGLRDGVARLWVYDVATATERLVADPRALTTGNVRGIRRYATDAEARVAAFPLQGRLYHADLVGGRVRALPVTGPVADPRPDPTGRWVGYLSAGAVRVRRLDGDGDGGGGAGDELLLAGEPDPVQGGQPYVTWGRPGWWWAPDGHTVLAARMDTRAPGRRVSLHLLDLDGGWVDVHWDRETYPLLVGVDWSEHGSPVIAVLRRSQQHGLVLAVDPRTGETQVHAELADPRWVEPVPGTPRHLPDGRVLVGGELAHDGYDARCLFADGTLLTPPALYVRRVVGRLPTGSEVLVEASAGEPAEQHLYRVNTSVAAAGVDTRRVTTVPGWHRAEIGGDTVAVGTESLDHPGTRWAVWRGGVRVGELGAGGTSGIAPRPVLQRVTDRRLPAGVLYPEGHVTGRRLPVLVDAGTGLSQGVRAARSEWLARRWWADAGFAVVVVDHRGTPGVAPSFEKVVHRRLADIALTDLAEALVALSGKHADLDLERVAVHGAGVGGWLAALAALRRPDRFRCAVVESPLVEWERAGGGLAERYLGRPDDGPDIYHHHSLLVAAAEPADDRPVSPVLLVPGRRTARAIRELAAAMDRAGRPHTVLAAGPPERVRRAARDFLRTHLTGGPAQTR
jgi:dipeptidyl-peptidase 4